MKVLALDFDGVISDSAPESFIIALETYIRMRRESIHVAAWERLARAELGEIRSDPLYRDFLEMMPLGNRAEDFAVELIVLEQGRIIRSQAEYDGERAAVDPVVLTDFHQRFYETRAARARRDPAAWRALLDSYPDFVELLRRRAGDVRLAVATAKDRDSVEMLLETYGLSHLIPGELLMDKEAGVSKRAHLERLRDRAGVSYSEMTFIDDKVNHLDTAARLGVRCALAAWGYNGSREVELALERGYLVCELADAEAQLFGGVEHPVPEGL